MEKKIVRISVLVSGNGTNLQALIDAIDRVGTDALSEYPQEIGRAHV